MLYIIKTIYNCILPPGCIIIALCIAAGYTAKRCKRSGIVVLAATMLLYFCSAPFITDTLVWSLEQKHRPPAVPDGDVVIMLGGGSTLDTPNISGEGHLSGSSANRFLTASRLARIYHLPILYSGGRVYNTSGDEAQIVKHSLMNLGFDESTIYIEQESLNTIQSVKMLKPRLAEYGFRKPILVTSAFHMERSIRIFQTYGIEVVPFPTDYLVNSKRQIKWQDFLPSFGAMYHLGIALREYMGILSIYTPYANI